MTINIEKLAQEVGSHLKIHGLTLATAESCTGGGIGYWITSTPGSSAWYDRGFITYSNQAKMDMLGVNATTLETHGAVSEATAREMAAGVLNNCTADISVVTTGIAGPDGGSAEKPVGTVWIAWAVRNKSIQTHVEIYTGNRQEIRDKTIVTALTRLLTVIR